jgi:hypothetical protein
MSYINKHGLEIRWQQNLPLSGWEDLDVELSALIEDGFIAHRNHHGPARIFVDRFNYIVFGWDGVNPYTFCDAAFVGCEHIQLFGAPTTTLLRVIIFIN